ncbi:hypothetical protein RUM44_013731 [Polyplax serrata]|uniref:Uncharacterized protein n=1 Tax=Polyplax serrata TaxID=468196 RepID=A0ABR1BJP0_POLSC
MNDRYPSRKKKNEFERVPEEDGSVWAHFLFFRGFRLLFFSVSGVATQLCVVTLNPKKFNFWTKSYETFENVAYLSSSVTVKWWSPVNKLLDTPASHEENLQQNNCTDNVNSMNNGKESSSCITELVTLSGYSVSSNLPHVLVVRWYLRFVDLSLC